VAFWLEALSRILALGLDPPEGDPARYVVRVLAYGMIILAIVDKNIGNRDRARRG
jgi:hypothetical protein